jgi:hypothetical protein
MERELLDQWHALPAEKRQEAIDFLQFLNAKALQPKKPFQSALGLCADLRVSVNAEEIDEARREMWGQFPREDF